MGRHYSTTAKRTSPRSPVMLLSALVVLVLVGGFVFYVVRDRLFQADCDTITTLNVTTAPDLAPVVDQVGRRVIEEDPADCYEVRVTSRDSASATESLALAGSDTPDVWIPESTVWLNRAQDKGAWSAPIDATSVASSPVVLALTDEVAKLLGWPESAPMWTEALTAESVRNARVGFPDPVRDPVGLTALIGLREVAKTAPDPGAAAAAHIRKLHANSVPQLSDLYAKLPGGGGSGDPFAIFPTSETALVRHNVKSVGTELVAVYPSPALPALDFPYAVLPRTPEREREVARKFLAKLIGPESATTFGDAGFRTPDGKVLRDRSVGRRLSNAPVERVPVPSVAEIDQLLSEWAKVNLSGRMLALLDVSGSMGLPVPGTPFDRMTITLKAAEAGLSLLEPTTKFGLWLFSTDLDGDKDYRELLPVAPIAEHVAAGALDKLRAIKAVKGGATGLYDTILAAYGASHQNWEPGRLNNVVVLTDGKNDNASGLTLEQLIAELAKLQDPRRPLPIVGIGIGPDVDPAELQAISTAAGGAAFIAADPTKITDVFYSALGTLLCLPPKCTPTP